MKSLNRVAWFYRSIRFGFVLVAAIVAIHSTLPIELAFAAKPITDPSSDILTAVNQWRIDSGLAPLKVNPTLQAMAMEQAKYIAPFVDRITDEAGYHLDAKGRIPAQRAVQPPYNWPAYGSSDQIEIGENAAVGTVKFAMDFWKNSAIHRQAALHLAYREVGVGIASSKEGTVYIMDFGARPGVLPVIPNPMGDALYITNEYSRYSNLTPEDTQIRIYDQESQLLVGPVPWTATVPIPKNATNTLFVLYTNNDFATLSKVSLSSPSSPTTTASTPTATETPTPTVTASPTSSATPTISIPTVASTSESTTSAGQAGNVTITPQVTATVTPTTLPSMTPTVTPSATSSTTPKPTVVANPDLILTYDSRTWTLYNNAGKALNLTGLSFGNSKGTVAISAWSAVASFPVASFPAGQCLQLELIGIVAVTPSNCRLVRSVIDLSASRQFWTQDTFQVKQNNVVIATCDAKSGRCEVVLPPEIKTV